MDVGFTRQEVEEVFDFIDLDQSKTIEFSELRSFYCKINGIPETLEDPDFQASSSKSIEHSNSRNDQTGSHRRKIFQHETSPHHEHSNHHDHEHSKHHSHNSHQHSPGSFQGN